MYRHTYFDKIDKYSADYFSRIISIAEAFLSSKIKIFRESTSIYMALSRLYNVSQNDARIIIDRYMNTVKFCMDEIVKYNRDEIFMFNTVRDNSKLNSVFFAKIVLPTIDDDGVETPLVSEPVDMSVEAAVHAHFTEMYNHLSVNPNAHIDDIERARMMSSISSCKKTTQPKKRSRRKKQSA